MSEYRLKFWGLFTLTAFFVSFGALSFVLVTLNSAYAQFDETPEEDLWEYHPSSTHAFEVRFPKDYKEKIVPFRLSNESIIYNDEIVSTIGDTADDLKDKTYIVKIDQTFGPPISPTKMTELVKKEAATYIRTMESMNASLHFEEDTEDKDSQAKELIFTFNENGETKGLRVKIIFTNSSRIQQVMSGPPGVIQSYKTDMYFDSIHVFPGILNDEGDIKKEWEKYESPHGLYTVYLPPNKKPFVDKPFKYRTISNIERGHVVYVDPLVGFKTTYDIYGYILDKKVYNDDIRALLYSKHLAKYHINMTRGGFHLTYRDFKDRRVAYAKIEIPASVEQPYKMTVYLQAMFRGKYVVVQEVRGDEDFVFSPLLKTIISSVEFHPEKAHEVVGGTDTDIESEDDDEDVPQDEEKSEQASPQTEQAAQNNADDGAKTEAKAQSDQPAPTEQTNTTP
ncbi:MAG: hypothetical protein KDI13_04105 [Alphaproteobacteria bacterium]|nr:hypothetical protein [Alphaproteobacteria bacterium]